MKKKQKSKQFLCKSCTRKLNHTALVIFAIVGVGILILSLISLSGYYIGAVSCRSHSMYPNLFCNCVFVAEKNPSIQMINVGDIITWQYSRDSNIIHRVVDTCTDGNGYPLGVRTKGDNNTQADGCIPESAIVGKVDAYWCP